MGSRPTSRQVVSYQKQDFVIGNPPNLGLKFYIAAQIHTAVVITLPTLITRKEVTLECRINYVIALSKLVADFANPEAADFAYNCTLATTVGSPLPTTVKTGFSLIGLFYLFPLEAGRSAL
jgi:hypothetical protein